MKKILLLSLVSFLFFNCSSSEFDGTKMPDNIELDLDQDGDIDFTLVYFQQTTGDPVGNYKEVRLKIESEQNQILQSDDEFPVFLNNTDLIQTVLSSPLYWEMLGPVSNISFSIASIKTDYDEITWNPTWNIFSATEKEMYLLGFKLIDGSASKVGFIEFSFDRNTGEFVLLKTEFI